MNIYVRDLKAHRKSLIIWGISMAFLIVAGMGKYSAGANAGAGSFNAMIEQMPKSLQNLFGVGIFDLSKPVEYFGILYLYILLVGSIHGAMLGAGIIAKEERDKTVEFLLVKPVSRRTIITSKLLSACTIIVLLNLVTTITSIGIFSYYSKGEPFITDILKLMGGLFCIQALFTFIGTFFAACIKKPKISSAVATGVLLVLFMLSIIIDVTGRIDFLRYITPFKYFDAKYLLKGGFEIVYPIITILLVILLIFGTYTSYQKRDLKV